MDGLNHSTQEALGFGPLLPAFLFFLTAKFAFIFSLHLDRRAFMHSHQAVNGFAHASCTYVGPVENDLFAVNRHAPVVCLVHGKTDTMRVGKTRLRFPPKIRLGYIFVVIPSDGCDLLSLMKG